MSPSLAPLTNGIYNLSSGTAIPVIASAEEISTIFVVGFPDDMLEREFQNMFLFSPGFEAATLKLPSKDLDEDSARRQIIGFAKFRTRAEALDARNVLNGRRVDGDKGCVLKAEMAKKNLHTKRASVNDTAALVTSTSTIASMAVPSGIGAMNMYGLSQPSLPAMVPGSSSAQRHSLSAYEAFHSVSASGLANDPLLSAGPSSSPFATARASVFALRAQSFDARLGLANEVTHGRKIIPSTSSSTMSSGFGPRHSDPLDLEHELGYLSKSTPTHTDLRRTPLFAPRAFSPPTTATLTGLASVVEEPFPIPLRDDAALSESLATQFAGMAVHASSPPVPISDSLTSPLFHTFGAIGTASPSDSHPPCNTLYVGNLPPNTNEDELRGMFSTCVGYKRHSFRNKAGGPMCFVEFEDTLCASQALQDLYGSSLSNSCKGGIRLSFSKNPLGVRQNTPNTTTCLPFRSSFSFDSLPS